MLASLGIYCVLLIVVDAVGAEWDSYQFVSIGPFCVDSPLATASESYETWVTVLKTVTAIELGLPAIITFCSFIVCSIKLSRPCANTFQATRIKEASKTVAIFTGVFLSCNLPFFSLMVLNTTTRALGYTWPEPFFDSIFMSQYSWLVAKIVLTVVNAAVNPVLYYCRMSSFESWVNTDGGNIGSAQNNQTRRRTPMDFSSLEQSQQEENYWRPRSALPKDRSRNDYQLPVGGLTSVKEL